MRKKCLASGHRFGSTIGLPFVFCTRWWCSASAVSVWAPPDLAVNLHNAIPKEDRVPPVELAEDGSVVRQWEEGDPSGAAPVAS
jgi:hypothetical protein